ncbi:MAG: MBL fold metallo-hydrolase [Steroidobacteraceae bacterium]
MNRLKLQRRSVLVGLGGLAASATLPSFAAGKRATLQISEIAPGILVAAGAGSNAAFVKGTGASFAIDTGPAGQARDVHRWLREQSKSAPLEVAFNTHWHPAHTGANELLRRDGVEIVAHENTRLWMGAPVTSRWNEEQFPARAPSALPTRTFYTTDRVEIGGHVAESGYLLQPHTDGDIYVRLPNANVLFTGDVFTTDRYPITDPATLGWIGGLATATDQLLKLTDAQTRVVPGSGPVADRAALEAQLKMVTTVRDRLYGMLREGKSVEEMLAAKPTAEFDARWGDPASFIRAAFAGMVAHVRQIPGIV